MKTKSLGLAIVLTLFFGPLGLFYASVTGGLVMCLIPLLLLTIFIFGAFAESLLLVASSLLLFYAFAVSYWIVCALWAATAVSNHNYKVIDNERQAELLRMINETKSSETLTHKSLTGTQVIVNNTKSNTDKPSLQDWRKNNPHSTINDYYRIYGSS